MAVPSFSCTYEYTYGAGNAPNRKVEFSGDGSKVRGTCYGKRKDQWKEISKIEECNMTLEGASATEKMRILMEARQRSQKPEYPPSKRFDEIPYDERCDVIRNLQPTGPYRMTVTNNLEKNPFFETIEHLTFFNPS